MDNTTLEISFGILSDAIGTQLSKQGFRYIKSVVQEFTDAKGQINDLDIMSICNEKEKVQMQMRLFRKIESHVKKQNSIKNYKNQ